MIAGLGHELTLTLALALDAPGRAPGGESAAARDESEPGVRGPSRWPLALIYALSGEVAKGEEACEAIVRIEGDTQLGCLFEDAASVGLFYVRRGQWDRARAFLDNAAAKNRGRNVAAYAACLVVRGHLHGQSRRT